MSSQPSVIMKYPLTTDYEDDDFHLAHAGPFVLMNWRGDYRADSFPRIEAVHTRLAERRKDDITGVSIVEAASPIPGDDIRVAGSDMMTRTFSTTKAVVIIFLDQGFMASALQSVAARELSLGGRVPMKFFHDLPSAAQWLSQLYPKLELAPLDVEQLMDKLRVRFSPSRHPGSIPPGEERISSGPPPSSGIESARPSSRRVAISADHTTTLPSQGASMTPAQSARNPSISAPRVRAKGKPTRK